MPAITATLREAATSDIEQIVAFLVAMQSELKEIELDADISYTAVSRSFTEGVHWFLFFDSYNNIFGCCHLQSVHKYWSLERRYYLGGFYIQPSHRKQGYFRLLNEELQRWASIHGGTSIYAHIHEENCKSLDAFAAVGISACDYKLCHKGWTT